MPLCTRLDGRSTDNRSIQIKDSEGVVVATVEAMGKTAELSVTTAEQYSVVKATGGSDEEQAC